MALIKIDWNPEEGELRRFGAMLAGFALLLAAYWTWRGHPRAGMAIAGAGLPLGALTAALPSSCGRVVYKGWMCAAFAVGSVVSPLLLGAVYYGVLTPLSLAMRIAGRDALRLKRPAAGTYWTPLAIPKDKSYYERLF